MELNAIARGCWLVIIITYFAPMIENIWLSFLFVFISIGIGFYLLEKIPYLKKTIPKKIGWIIMPLFFVLIILPDLLWVRN
jgi:hypothetical protein